MIDIVLPRQIKMLLDPYRWHQIEQYINDGNIPYKNELWNDTYGYVYFLIDDDEIIYIGQTTGGYNRRLREHDRRVKFDCFAILFVGRVEQYRLNAVERKCIEEYSPILNGCLSRYEKCYSRSDGIKTAKEILDWYKKIKVKN